MNKRFAKPKRRPNTKSSTRPLKIKRLHCRLTLRWFFQLLILATACSKTCTDVCLLGERHEAIYNFAMLQNATHKLGFFLLILRCCFQQPVVIFSLHGQYQKLRKTANFVSLKSILALSSCFLPAPPWLALLSLARLIADRWAIHRGTASSLMMTKTSHQSPGKSKGF